jgi:hypothetical protein
MNHAPGTVDDQFIETVVENAVKHADNLKHMKQRDRRRYVRDVMQEAEVVFAVWYEGDDRYIFCIKGINTTEAKRVSFHAIFVKSEADALGIRREWGDGELPTWVM